MKKRIGFFTALFIIFSIFLIVSPGASRTLKIGVVVAPTSNEVKALETVFKPYIEKKSNGKLIVKVFPSEQLGHAPDQVEAVRMGTQAMFYDSITWWAARVKEMGMPTIPFMFDGREHFYKWVDNVLAKELMAQLIKISNQRFINLNVFWEKGPYRVICSKKPIFSPDDIVNLKLRLWPAKMIQKSWSGMGAKIHTVDWAEAYLALQQGVVEAITSPADLVWPQKFTEVTKYVTELKQFPQIGIISFNEKLWQSLSENERKIITEAANKAGKWYNDTSKATLNSIIDNKIIKKHSVAWIKVNRQPFVDKFRKVVVPQLIKDGIVEENWVKKVTNLR